jgi:hypothetical protein
MISHQLGDQASVTPGKHASRSIQVRARFSRQRHSLLRSRDLLSLLSMTERSVVTVKFSRSITLRAKTQRRQLLQGLVTRRS